MALGSFGVGRSIAISLLLAADGFTAGLNQASGALGSFVRNADGHMTGLRNTVAAVSGAMVAGFGLAVAASMEFEASMSAVAAVSGATGREMDKLKDQAISLGAETVFSATEVAKAQEELLKAGVSTADVLGGALKGTLDLAASAGMDLAQAAEIAANALNTFGLKGSDVTHVADVLSAAANKSATDVPEMGMALKQVGLIADQLGISLEETSGALAMFAQAGLKGSDAGTSLKTMLMRLNPSTEAARSAMKNAGLDFFDASENFIGLEKAAGQLHEQLKGMSQEKRMTTLQQVFGQDAIRAATLLYEQGADGIAYWVKQVDDSGYAAEVAAKRLDNLKGDLEALGGSMESVMIRSGEKSNQALRGLVQGATDAVNGFGELPPIIGQGAVGIMGIVGAAGLAVTAFGFLIPALQAAKAGFIAMGGAAQTMGTLMTMANFKMMAVGMGAIGLAAAAVLVQVGNLRAKGKEMFNEFAANLDAPTNFTGYANNINAITNEYERLQKVATESTNLGKLGEFLNPFNEDKVLEASSASLEFQNNIKQLRAEASMLETVMADLKPALGMTEEQILSLAEATDVDLIGAIQGAANSGDSFAAAYINARRVQEEMKPVLKANFDTLHDGNPALQDTAGAWSDVSDETKSAADQLDGYMDAVAGLLGIAFDERAALDDIMEARNGFAEVVTKYRETTAGWAMDGAWEANSEGALAMRDYLKGIATNEIPAYAEALGRAGITGDDFHAKLNQQVDDLIASAVAMGIPEEAAHGYFDALYLLPEYVPTEAELLGVPEGLTAAERLQWALDNLSQGADGNVAIHTADAEAALQRVGGLLAGIAGHTFGGSIISGFGMANGGILAFADGGHHAQIASAGSPMRLWNEPETGGEAYIPLAQSKRPRSVDILRQTNRMLGSPIGGGGSVNFGGITVHATSSDPAGIAREVAAAVTQPAVIDKITRGIRRSEEAITGSRR